MCVRVSSFLPWEKAIMKDDSELNIRKTQHLSSQEVYDSMMPTTVMFYF